jgi:hypothetical protein
VFEEEEEEGKEKRDPRPSGMLISVEWQLSTFRGKISAPSLRLKQSSLLDR